jgi:ankyrin repeat protein
MFGKKVGPVFGCILALLIGITLGGCVGVHKEVLHQNIKDHDLAMLKENIEKGDYSVNEKDGYGFTPLIVAAYYDYAPAAEYLCAKGTNINAQNNEGLSALMLAVYYGHDNVFNILMDHGADVNLVNNLGHNAIWYAKHYKREEMYRRLEEVGAQPQ